MRDGPTHRGARPTTGFTVVLGILLFTIAAGLMNGAKYGSLFIFGYIMIISYTMKSVRSGRISLGDIGVKRVFFKDLKRVWYYFGADAILFQILPPTLGVALLFGFYGEEVQHITGRFGADFASVGGLSVLGATLALLAVVTLMEEVVFRVTIQERLGWMMGTPAAILVTACIFGSVHAVGTAGSLQVILTDVLGVAFDGVFFGIIYARTHNLAVTWATHFTADVVGLLSLVFIL